MTEANFSIAPSPELFAEWLASSMKTVGRTIPENDRGATGLIAGEVAIQAARWGADQELEACCEYEATVYSTDCADGLRRHRRPEPPSLKEQALEILGYPKDFWSEDEVNTIRRALEQLDD